MDHVRKAIIAAVSAINIDSTNFIKTKGFFRKSTLITLGVVGIFILLALFFSTRSLFKNETQATLGATDKRVDLQQPLKQQALNRQFAFPLKGDNGVEVSKIKYDIQNAETRNEIVISGQKATAIAGRTFLVLNLKITNDFDQSVKINARDYVRLMVNNSTEKLAPDIHNDPVEIQAISTKYTRVGFPINDTDKNLTLQVGEIKGDKQDIPLNLK